MKNVDSKSCASRSLVRELSRLIRQRKLSRNFILNNYKIREIAWGEVEWRKIDAGAKTLKSLHTILQIGVFFRCGEKIAVFRRPSVEKDGSAKLTSSFSALRSWSPASLCEEDMAMDLAKKARLNAGPDLKWIERGIAFSDIFEPANQFAPHYLFLIYEINLDDEKRLGTKGHLNQRKNTEVFAGWFDPKCYNANSFHAEFDDRLEERYLTITFEGAIDRLILTSLNRGDMEDLIDTTRGLARYFPTSNLIHDVEECEIQLGWVEFDEYMEQLIRVIQKIRDQDSGVEKEVTIQDVIMFEPNFNGMGIRGPEFLAWLKKHYNKAFN